MKKILVLTLATLVVVLLGCVDWNRVSEADTNDYDAGLYNRVEIETGNGEIAASVNPDTVIGVTLTRWATGITKSRAREHMNEIDVHVTRDTAERILRIFVELPKNIGYSAGCDVELSLPESLYVDLETSNGKIEVNGHQVGLRLHTSNGTIDMAGTAGYAEIKTSNGDITVEVHTGDIDGETSNGRVTADVVMPDSNGTCDLASSNGNITVAVPESVGAEVRLKTSNGKLTVEGLGLGDFNPDDDIFESTMGDGSGEIDLETSNGNVTLKKL